jgi:hypothetical protein
MVKYQISAFHCISMIMINALTSSPITAIINRMRHDRLSLHPRYSIRLVGSWLTALIFAAALCKPASTGLESSICICLSLDLAAPVLDLGLGNASTATMVDASKM